MVEGSRQAVLEKLYGQKMGQPGVLIRQITLEAVRQPRGSQHDAALPAMPWGPLEHVRVGVHLWHGDLDTNVPLPVAQALARALPTAQLTVVPGRGHLSLRAIFPLTVWAEAPL